MKKKYKKQSSLLLTLRKISLDHIAYFLILVFFVAGTLVSLHRFWQYEVSYIDFGHYDQTIWRVSRFQAPIVHHFIHGDIIAFGDHVTPSVYLISPLYWLTERSEMILIVQALAVALSGYFLYATAKKILANSFLSLSLLICYFCFVGLQNAVITEFHELTVMTLPLTAAVWALVHDKKELFYLLLVITLGFKEVTFALGIGLGIAIFLLKKEWKIPGIITIAMSVLWGVLCFYVIIPFFSSGSYLYASAIPEGIAPKITALFDEPLKRRTLFFSFASFSFLPLLSPAFWLALLQDYAARFLPLNFITRWDLGMHYNAQSAVLLTLSSMFALQKIIHIERLKKYVVLLGVVLMLNAAFLFRFILHGPFLLAIHPDFYQHTKSLAFLDEIVLSIPKDASVMTHNNLATRFTHQEVRLLQVHYEQYQPDYILLDLRAGQSPNNFFGADRPEDVFQKVSNDPQYKKISTSSEQHVFKKIK